MKAPKIIASILILAALMASCFIEAAAVQVGGGEDIFIIGIGNNSSGDGRPPTYDIRYPTPLPADPSQYRSPASDFVPPVPPGPDEELNWSSGRRGASILFEMAGEVNGEGSFKEYRSINDIAGLNSKQTSSASYGNMILSRRLLVISDQLNYSSTEDRSPGHLAVTVREEWPTYISTRDYVDFLGINYRGREIYSNNGDLIKTNFVSGKVTKDSIYIGGLDNALLKANVSSNATEVGALYNKSSSYSIDARYIGSYNINMDILNNGRKKYITENYIGDMKINMKLLNQERFKEPEDLDESQGSSWLM